MNKVYPRVRIQLKPTDQEQASGGNNGNINSGFNSCNHVLKPYGDPEMVDLLVCHWVKRNLRCELCGYTTTESLSKTYWFWD